MIYCSNLCTEIAQILSEIESVSTEVKTDDGDTVVVRASNQVILWYVTLQVCR